ncbi:MFS transporter [Pontibacillus litoralis]|uniref:MFS transporter n=1 Tax=Pontibacillus litoralis JSM 072002 TaxID=1385512 RepID=A0A0A5HX04_9BACI|nr:MFS transporter [Pontibacillus litoralis JSM 072002]
MERKNFRLIVLISLVSISGFTQGMLLPLIAIILEQIGVASSVNGLHATSLYIGVLITSPFMEKPLRKFGYKPLILIGGLLVIFSLSLFPFWQSLGLWFMLRMFVGIGDHMLHFSTQTWITASSPIHKRGRNIAIYGMSFGLGFTLGPLMTRLLEVHQALPFLVASILSLIVWSFMFFIRNEIPEEEETYSPTSSSMKRFASAWKYAWVAFLPPFGFGFLEASLHSSFPVYGMRIGYDVNTLSFLIPTFAAGSLISQLPLGMLSDRIGRKKVLVTVIFLGIICFFLASLFEHSLVALLLLFTLAGLCVGSIYSLGISYMTDILPKHLLPAGNIMCGITFSIGSIIGPYIGGLYIEQFPNASFFHVITGMLLLIVVPMMIKKQPKLEMHKLSTS